MINGQPCLGVIPARGGSKRIPRKNIMKICGKPLIQWTIEAGLGSEAIDRIIVSTDDEEISTISRDMGADVPFIRPARLAEDSICSYDVLEHALQMLREKYIYIAMLQPTSPLRTAYHIDEAATLLCSKMADGVASVTEVEHPIEWCNTLPTSLEMTNFVDSKYGNIRSQDLPTSYRLNGAIFISTINRMQAEKSHVYGKNMFAYKMTRSKSVDIDEYIDFQFAELLLRNQAI